jgi:chemotaxis protein MotB
VIFAGGSGFLEKDGNSILPLNPGKSSDNTGKTDKEMEDDKMNEIKELLEENIEVEGFSDKIVLVLNEEGLGISIQDSVLFASGDATVMRGVSPVLDLIAETLSDIDNKIKIVGHTDNVPIKNSRYRSNWDLSAMRAINVMQFLVDKGNLEQERLLIQGNGEYSPKYSNSTKEGRAKNRRVDIIVVRKHPVDSSSEEN